MRYDTETYKMTLFEMSLERLKSLPLIIRAEVDAGLMTSKEAHDKINQITVAILVRENNLKASELEK